MVGFYERNFSQIRAQNRKADVIQLGQVISDENASCLTLNWNKTGPDIDTDRYRATPVACGWAVAVFEVTRAFGQEQ